LQSGVQGGLAATSFTLADRTPAKDNQRYRVSDSLRKERLATIQPYFGNVEFIDSFVYKVEAALAAPKIDITGKNSITIANLCRDESNRQFQDRIEDSFGESFSAHALGGLVNVGRVGMQAGMSHSPIVDGIERYIFVAMPHIAIEQDGSVGKIARPGRLQSKACGAIYGVLKDLLAKATDGTLTDAQMAEWDKMDPVEPEYSVLRSKLAKRLLKKNVQIDQLDLVTLTKEAQGLIEEELRALIRDTVDTQKADYAVITGVQIHSSMASTDNGPTLEFVSPGALYTVIGGRERKLELPGGEFTKP
jgi:hypothetical protein